MDFFDNPNWYLTKTLLSCFGAWPFQTSINRTILRSIVVLLIISLLIPQIFRIFTMWGDLDIVIECASTVFLHIVTMINMFHCYLNTESEKQLLMSIQKTWKSCSTNSEVKYLQIYATANNIITRTYIFCVYGATILCIFMTMVPKILDCIVPLDKPRVVLFMYQTEYFVDPVKYDLFILAHSYIVAPFQATIIIAFDSLYASCAQHACSMFFIIGDRMENLAKFSDYNCQKNQRTYKNELTNSLTNCIKEHVEALEFARDVRTTYSNALFLILGTNMLAISITGCHTVSKLNEPFEAMRFGSFMICQLAHLYFLSWPGQQLMDHSSYLFQAVYQGNWYDIPKKTRRLLVLIMMRCCRPCTLTAGKIFIMSMENFALIVKTSVSYFTVLSSMQ